MLNSIQNGSNPNQSISFKGAFKIPFREHTNGAIGLLEAAGIDCLKVVTGKNSTSILVNNPQAEKRIVTELDHMQYVYNDKQNMSLDEFADFAEHTKMRVYDGLDLKG